MKRSVILFFVLSVIYLPVWAGNYYAGFSSGSAAQQISLVVVDNATDPQIPNVLVPKDYQAGELDVTTGSFFLGYRMGSDMALEVGVIRIADLTGKMRAINSVDIDPATNHVAEETVAMSLNYVSWLGVWPLTENLAFQIRAGLANWSFDYAQTIYAMDSSTQALSLTRVEAYSDNNISGIYGAGFSYAVGDWIEMSLKYEVLDIEPVFVNIRAEDSIQLMSLGLVMHF
ncbi:MAG: hypothetical protein HYZ31_03305 [Gammaproteobacteria bacterium]|nr:hypothetical protein [Gammaproteobacteria bacterium]